MFHTSSPPWEGRIAGTRVGRPEAACGQQREALLSSEGFRLVGVDAAAVAVGTAVADSWTASLAGAGLSVTALAAAGMYRPRLHRSALDDLPRTVLAICIAWAVYGWITTDVPAPMLPAASMWWWLVVAACVVLARTLGYESLRQRRRRGSGEPAVVVGTGEVGVRLAGVLLRCPDYGLRPVGFLGLPPPDEGTVLPVPLLGPVGALNEVVRHEHARNVIVAFPTSSDSELVPALRYCQRQGRTVFVVPRLFEMNVNGMGAELVEGLPLVRLRPPAFRQWAWRLKRLLDLAIASLCLMLLAPLFLACAVAVRVECGRGGVLFRQERVGWDGRRFSIIKFRSLTPSSDSESQTCWNISNDSRIGPVGRLLRRTSLDELPQIINVLRGEMSLVGPRPERPFFVDQFQASCHHYGDRHRVPAGMTGWAQIHGLCGDTSIEDRASFDNYYIENWSCGLDLKILIRTIPSIFGSHRG